MPKCFDCEDFFTCDGQCEIECEKCKHFEEEADTYTEQCEFYFMECRYEPKDEPQTDNDIRCITCKHNPWVSKACREYKGGICDNYEPQTEMPELNNIGEAFKDFCDKTDIGWK